MSPSTISIAEDVDFKDKMNSNNNLSIIKSNHQRQPSDPTILNDNGFNTKNNESKRDSKKLKKKIFLIF